MSIYFWKLISYHHYSCNSIYCPHLLWQASNGKYIIYFIHADRPLCYPYDLACTFANWPTHIIVPAMILHGSVIEITATDFLRMVNTFANLVNALNLMPLISIILTDNARWLRQFSDQEAHFANLLFHREYFSARPFGVGSNFHPNLLN